MPFNPLTRRNFIGQTGVVTLALAMPLKGLSFSKNGFMTNNKHFDVIIIGGSYSGLAAAMALGRALKRVLIIDSGLPCNRQTPYSHNFITQDGNPPNEIATIARQQVQNYDTIMFLDNLAITGTKNENGFEIEVDSGDSYQAKKLIFATGVKDIMPNIEGFAECWGISVLHCPYCHGYEVRNEKTGILANGHHGFEFSSFISNWTDDLTLYTNGPSTLTDEQTTALKSRNISIIENEIERFAHQDGLLQNLVFKDGSKADITALYAHCAFEQHCPIPENLGCTLTEEGYVTIDDFQKTTVEGVYACGDCTTQMRTVSNAVAMGSKAGMFLSKELIMQEF